MPSSSGAHINPAIDILIQGSHGKDDPERASLPFILGNAAATAGREVTVLLSSDAVWLVTEGFASDIEFAAQPTVGEMIAQLVDNGGAIWACAACTGPRGIERTHLVDGVEIVSAAHVTAALVDGVNTVGFWDGEPMLLFEATNGADDPERANLPFIRANVAAAMGLDAAVHLVGEAVWMATTDGGCHVRYGGHPSVAEMADALLNNGGRILVDASSAASREIALDGLRSGTELVTTAEFAALMHDGVTTLRG